MYLGAHMLRSIVRTVLLALTLAGGGVLSFMAHAAVPQVDGWKASDYPTPNATPLGACQDRWPAALSACAMSAPPVNAYLCRTAAGCLGSDFGTVAKTPMCPPNSTQVSGACVCDSGYVEDGASCVSEPACEVGKSRGVNHTVGWARSSRPDADDLAIKHDPINFFDYNDGLCVGTIASVDSCWRSQEPAANGLYRVSCDMTMVMTGDAMEPGDPNADPLTPNPSCPGFLGEINGKPACVGTSSSPLPSDPRPDPSPQPGNPTAGEIPTVGEGSGTTGPDRTPSAGSGGNTGGPASAAVRPGYTPPTPGEDTGQPCGGPGQPVCSVKIDETGTPTNANGIFDGAGSGVDEQSGILSGLLDTIESWDIGSWTWTFALPTGCTPLETYLDVVIDPCQWMAEVHDIMSVLWILTGIAGLFVIYSRAF